MPAAVSAGTPCRREGLRDRVAGAVPSARAPLRAERGRYDGVRSCPPVDATLAGHRLTVLRRRTAATLVLLAVQFLVGMSVNLYVTIPTHHSGAGSGPYLSGALASVLWSFSSGLPLLIVHVAIGVLLLLSSVELLVHAVRSGRGAAPIWLAAGGLIAIIFAGFNGASFLKYNLDISSMLMSVGFAVAVVCYVGLLSIAA